MLTVGKLYKLRYPLKWEHIGDNPKGIFSQLPAADPITHAKRVYMVTKISEIKQINSGTPKLYSVSILIGVKEINFNLFAKEIKSWFREVK